MIQHLSTKKFIHDIADYRHGGDWLYRGIRPAVILFYDSTVTDGEALGFEYAPLAEKFNQVDFYLMRIDDDPRIAQVYNIRKFPAVMFIPLQNPPEIIYGVLTVEEMKDDVENLVEGKRV